MTTKNSLFGLLVLLALICSTEAEAQALPPRGQLSAQITQHLLGLRNHGGTFGLATTFTAANSSDAGFGIWTGGFENETALSIYGSQIEVSNNRIISVGVSAPIPQAAGLVSAGVTISHPLGNQEITVSGAAEAGLNQLIEKVVNRIPLALEDEIFRDFALHIFGGDNPLIELAFAGEVGLDFGRDDNGVGYMRINTRASFAGSGTPWDKYVRGTRAEGIFSGSQSVAVARSWQITLAHAEYLCQCRMPELVRRGLDPNGVLGDINGNRKSLVKGNGKNNQPIWVSSNSDVFGLSGKYVFGKANFSQETYEILNDPSSGNKWIVSIPGFDIENLDTYQFSAGEASDIKIPQNIFSDFGGADFADVQVAAIDTDNANKVIDFILKADRNGSGGTNLQANGNLLRNVFLTSLSMPNNKQNISLDWDNGGYARAYEPFKKTDMAQILFAADVEMKKEAIRHLWERANPQQKFLEMLHEDGAGKLFSIYTRGGVPNVRNVIRNTFYIDVPNGNKDGRNVYIEDAKFYVDGSIIELDVDLGGVSVSQNELDWIKGIVEGPYREWLEEQIDIAGDLITTDVRNNIKPEYRQMNRILPAIVAAHWYKQSSVKDGVLEKLIDTGEIDGKYTGYSIRKPFNQAYWNSQAYQYLATINYNVLNIYKGTVNVYGGATITDEHNHLSQNLNNRQRNTINRTVDAENGYTNVGGKSFIEFGAGQYVVPELLSPTGIKVVSSNTDNLLHFQGALIKNRPVTFSIQVMNTGNKRATSAPLAIWARMNDDAYTKIISVNLPGIAPKASRTHTFQYTPYTSGALDLVYSINPNENVYELSYANNSRRNRFLISDFPNHAIGASGTSYSSGTYFASAEDLIESMVSYLPGSEVKYHTTGRIRFKPGFQAKSGTKLKAYVASNAQGINAYNECVPIGANLPNTIQALPDAEPRREAPNDPSSEAFRLASFDTDTEPKITYSNYTLIEQRTIGPNDALVYPNPTTDQFKLNLVFDADEMVTLELYGTNGTLRKTFVTTQSGASLPSSFDVADVDPGLYLIKIVSDKGYENHQLISIK